MKENVIISHLKQLADLYNGKQKEFYEMEIADAKVVRVVSVSEVLTKEQIELIKQVVKPQPKQCYKNAFLVANLFNEIGVKYVEGMSAISIVTYEHAFNKIGDKYFDVTAELVLKQDLASQPYIVFGEYTKDEALRIMEKNNMITGDVYRTILLSKLAK
jgi:hypothetical protein